MVFNLALFFCYNFRIKEVAGVVREADEAAKAAKMEELKSETIPFYLEKLDATAKENNGHLALGQVKRNDFGRQFFDKFRQIIFIFLLSCFIRS